MLLLLLIIGLNISVDEPSGIDLANAVDHSRIGHARGRLVTGSKIYGASKEYVSFYTPDVDGKFR